MNINNFIAPPGEIDRARVFAQQIQKSTKLFTPTHLSILRDRYGAIASVNPEGPAFTKLRAEVASWTQEIVTQVAGLQPPIKWLSYLAQQELAKRAAAVDKLAEQYPGIPCTLEP